jgi:hypothetical protein
MFSVNSEVGSFETSGLPFIDLNTPTFTAYGTIIGGFGYYFDSLFTSTSIIGLDSEFGNWTLQSTGFYANEYMSLGADIVVSNFTTTWRDPMDDMIDTVNQVAFRTSVQYAINNPDLPNSAQVVPYSGGRMTTVYQSNYTLMAVALVINFLALLSLFPIYYGWWELGRNSTLGVLETAKAFGAPLLRDVGDNDTTEQMLQSVGSKRVRYGEVFVSGIKEKEFLVPRKRVNGKRLQIVEEEKAMKPKIGSEFGSVS